MLKLDHLVLSSADLGRGTGEIESLLGVSLAPGGQHAAMGTHNRLLSLGPDLYLEVIAINPEAEPPQQPRWFDLDRFEGATRPTNWVCEAKGLEAALPALPQGVGALWQLERGDLRWQMAVPATGRLPFDDCFPALLEWQGAAHPAARLPDRGVRLETLEVCHPEAAALSGLLTPLLSDPRLRIKPAPRPELRFHLTTPSGPVTL